MDLRSDDVPWIILLGGGVESTYLVRQFLNDNKSVLPVYVHWGMLWEDVEMEYVRRFCEANASENLLPLKVIHSAPTEDMSEHWALTGCNVPKAGDGPERLEIPVRNLSLLRVVARQFDHLPRLNLVMGTTADNCYSDGSRVFFETAGVLLSRVWNTQVDILTPLIAMHKSDVIRISDRATLAMSFSCINPVDGLHCGMCVKCGSRKNAFREAGVDDPTSYVQMKYDEI